MGTDESPERIYHGTCMPVAWLKAEMKRMLIGIEEKEWE